MAVLEQFQAELADRYRIERELGHGGMATVFLAHDLRHARPIALKVLHPDLAREREPGVALNAKDPLNRPYNEHQLAHIYLLVGDPEKALNQLEQMLKIPSYLSPAWLRIDPTFASLRGNPRFERLLNR